MVQQRYKIANWLALALLLTMSCGFQTSFWYHLTGGAPAPQIWLIVLLYITLYRSYFTAMTSIYILLGTVIKAYSAVPLGMLWFVFFLLVSFANFVKRRMFWSTANYFIIATAAFATSYNIVFICVSKFFEENSTNIAPLTRLGEIALTVLCAYPMFWFLQALDQWTLREVAPNKGVTE